MRCLTVRQPWAAAIAHHGKDVENRTWTTNYRGPIAILAGRHYDDWALPTVEELAGTRLDRMTAGAVLAVADLVDVHPGDTCRTGEDGVCSPWADIPEPAEFHWILANVRPLARPYGLMGSLGLRILPAALEQDILDRIAPTATTEAA